MKPSPYPVPSRRWGKQLKTRSFGFDLPFVKALVWFAGKETKRYKMKVSQAAVLKRGALQTFPELHKKYLDLKELEVKETIHAKKESNRTRVEPDPARERQESDIRATAAQFDDRAGTQA